jgi:hypothetical protein
MKKKQVFYFIEIAWVSNARILLQSKPEAKHCYIQAVFLKVIRKEIHTFASGSKVFFLTSNKFLLVKSGSHLVNIVTNGHKYCDQEHLRPSKTSRTHANR